MIVRASMDEEGVLGIVDFCLDIVWWYKNDFVLGRNFFEF
jgi:hypothetical protein